MQKESRLIPKTRERLIFLEIRKHLSLQRKTEASAALLDSFLKKGSVLSFASFATEIDVRPLNAKLAAEKRLLLPRIEGDFLVPYWVRDPQSQLMRSPLGFMEPNKSLCLKADWADVENALVPGIVFDRENYRLGYGKGFYDRLLTEFDGWSTGIGYREQLSDRPVPRDPWDLPTDDLLLV